VFAGIHFRTATEVGSSLDAAAGRIQTLVNKCGFTNVFLGELGGRDRIVPVA
jgi:hypothetical protein